MAACLLASSLYVPFTEVANATQRRAVCMDGSPAGYYYSAGSGVGAKNWLLYLQRYELWRKDVVSSICKAMSYGEKLWFPLFAKLYLQSYELWRKAVVSSICKAISYGEKLWFPVFAKL
ncbi:hypothetical protein SASPL_122182 [Salvia splendens]|uniref:Pectin acetylesterase n=1 Tax=Salvia splendens TaxID=180675 RepID=A0A8X8ZS08_SALSN|nr:hypothetical protein SASPL_122182 [Salvia splendens]